ncbi:MAG TPA: dihydroorotase [Clostridiaceae bacterium]|jgi:dihydroorotase|nr:dihydroorotase [Clostridiaceae bacterium]
MKLLVKSGHVVDPKSDFSDICDILTENGIIVKMGRDLHEEADDLIDAAGKYVIPGLVDCHCHLRDPGYEYKEDIATGTRSAAAGGFTSIACMPNTNPVADNQAVLSYISETASRKGVVNVFPIGAITKGQQGKELADIGELKFAGAVGISDDGNPVENSMVMLRALQYSSAFNIRVISHCEDKSLTDGGVMNEGYYSTVMGLRGVPAVSESVMVSRDLLLSEYTGIPIHIAHVSTEMSVNLIRNAKKRGVKVTCETCPHYFSLDESACSDFNTMAKVNPPLRSEKDVNAIIEGLKDGTIDIIATDHAPHHMDEKNVEFNLAANGITGFETALPLAIAYLVKKGHLTMEQLVKKMCCNPANMLGIRKGTLEVGGAADIAIVDVNEEYTVDTSKFISKGKNSPFNGFKLYGKPSYTIVGGKIVVRDKKLMV